MSKTVLLTGATGYLGSNMLKMLLQESYEVIALKRSTSKTFRLDQLSADFSAYNIDKTPIVSIFAENKIDYIVHTATNYGRGENSLTDLLAANLSFPVELLQLAIKHEVEAFVNTDTALPREINNYARSKKQFTEWLVNNSKNIRAINIVPEYFYGAGDDPWKLIPMIVTNLIKGSKEINFTSGEQKRDFIHVDDLVEAYKTVLKNMETFSSFTEFSVGSGELISIKELALLCKQISGNSATEFNFGAIPSRPNEFDQHASEHKEMKNLGWSVNISLEQGLKNLINNA